MSPAGCLAAVLGFGRAAGAGFVGAWALVAAGLHAPGTGWGARLGGFPRRLGGGVLDEDMVVVADQVVLEVEVGSPMRWRGLWRTAEGPGLQWRA